MKFLITTPLQILLFDMETNRLTPLRCGDGEYFGISWDAERVATGHAKTQGLTLVTWKDYQRSIKGYIQLYRAEGQPPHQTPPELIQPHQILCTDNKILAANTGRNCLTVFGADGALERHVYVNEKQWDKNENGEDGNHFNSLYREGDTLYFLSHNFKHPSQLWVLSWPDLEVREVLDTTAGWAHNIWPCEHGLVICDSRNKGLYDVRSGKTLWAAEENGVMTRGLAASEDLIFVGRSELGGRSTRKVNDGGMWIVNRHTLKTEERILFRGVGVVKEIRIINQPDACHPEGGALTEARARTMANGSLGASVFFQSRRHAAALHQLKARGMDQFWNKWAGLKKRLASKG